MALFDPDAMQATPQRQQLLVALEARAQWMEPASSHVIEAISDVQHDQGIILAVPFDRPAPPRQRLLPGNLATCSLVLDAVADPGNMGTVLRIARTAGVGAVYISQGSVDPFAPKVVRAAAGAHFWLPIYPGFTWSNAGDVLPAGTRVLADATGGQAYWHLDWTRPATLIVSNEAHGATPAAHRAATTRVRIPMPGGGESLNVAAATSILLYEAVRQRSIEAGKT